MFDALVPTKSGLTLPQVPQRAPSEVHDPSVDMVGMLGGSLAGYASRNAFEPRTLAIAGAAVWAGTYLAGRTMFGEPHDYFGRANAPSNLSYGLLAIAGGFGSTWALSGLWHVIKDWGRR